MTTSITIAGWARGLLEGGTLADKLASPPPGAVDVVGPAEDFAEPARAPPLAMVDGADKLPKLGDLTSPAARLATLSRFAHHELMATELFAWALLKFPDAPLALRRGFVAALVEEQAHLRLYVDRLAAHGAVLGDVPLSGYFWKLVPAIRTAPDPLRAFLCAQGLTLEQANLDFTILYRDAFRLAGDFDSAAVLQRIHDDEVAHVRLARAWLVRDDDAADADRDRYEQHVPFPLSAARAKGRRFEAGARRRAGLSDAFIAYVRDARPYAAAPWSPSSPTGSAAAPESP
ncbi:MAG: ferritin-like domain-containing protein [Deltaproteobacteria bacterium]|nr:ferritin-like domain-containing protein [Deltaproteobacteria bacterium]